jgi:hypothetical protein
MFGFSPAMMGKAAKGPIEFISVGPARATSISSMPEHQSGDLLLMNAYRTGSSIAPGLPTGWTSIRTVSDTSAARLAYKFSASSSEVSGTWANAYELRLYVIRNVSAIGGSSANLRFSGSSSVFNSVTLVGPPSHVLGLTIASISSYPPGMVEVPISPLLAITDGPVSNFPTTATFSHSFAERLNFAVELIQ